ncbi:MAG: helix-turn-helix transcriptional regulator [Candidatus Gastranaerophilales bacterium]
MDKNLLGKQIKQFRLAKGISQEKLSEIIEISPRQMCIIENGSSIPTLDTFIKIAKALDIDINSLFNISHKELNHQRANIIGQIKTIPNKKLPLLQDIILAIITNS